MKSFKGFIKGKKILAVGKDWLTTRTATDVTKKMQPLDRATASKRSAPEEDMKKISNLHEVSKDTLKSYIKKASDSRAKAQGDATDYQNGNDKRPDAWKKYGDSLRTVIKRRNGIRKAVDKLEE